MPRLFRQPYTKPIPQGAERCTLKGKPAVHFIEDGRTVTAPLTRKGDRIRLLSTKWYGEYVDADGFTRRVPLSTDKTAAQQMLAQLVHKAEMGKGGCRDPFEEQRLRPLLCPVCQSKGRAADDAACDCPAGAHLTDYRRALEAKEKEPRYVFQIVSHCAAIFNGMGVMFTGDIDANKVETWLAEFRRDTEAGISTSNHYLTSAKGFTRWLTKTRPPRLSSDSLACLAKLNAETDIRKQRRDLAVDEAVRLLDATRRSERDYRGLSGEDRYILYAVAFQSGLRAGELASLTPASFVLDLDPPFIRVHAKRSKRRKKDEQPIPRDLADALRLWLDGKPADQPVWPGTWREKAFIMIGKDLATARQAWIEEAGADVEERQRRERPDDEPLHAPTAPRSRRGAGNAALAGADRAERGSAGTVGNGNGWPVRLSDSGRVRLTVRLPSGLPER